VASAVQPHKLHAFAAACRAFLKTPNVEFFYPLKTQPLSFEELQETLAKRGSALVFLVFGGVEAVPDVFWGQMHRTRKALRKQLELADFRVLRDGGWSGHNAEVSVLVFEVEQQVLSSVKMHLGPPLQFAEECDRFLEKYAANLSVVAGPFIDNGRWVVEVRRKFTDAAEYVRSKTQGGGRDVGVAYLIANAMPDSSVLVGDEMRDHYIYNEEFAAFLTDFLSGKPFWLEEKCGR
jgi:tRNA nucleotidyltransferase (CCA-adding enzyme)